MQLLSKVRLPANPSLFAIALMTPLLALPAARRRSLARNARRRAEGIEESLVGRCDTLHRNPLYRGSQQKYATVERIHGKELPRVRRAISFYGWLATK